MRSFVRSFWLTLEGAVCIRWCWRATECSCRLFVCSTIGESSQPHSRSSCCCHSTQGSSRSCLSSYGYRLMSLVTSTTDWNFSPNLSECRRQTRRWSWRELLGTTRASRDKSSKFQASKRLIEKHQSIRRTQRWRWTRRCRWPLKGRHQRDDRLTESLSA